MKTTYKKFRIKYSFIHSFWNNESMTVLALNIEQARQKTLDEISGAYGSQILPEVKILN